MIGGVVALSPHFFPVLCMLDVDVLIYRSNQLESKPMALKLSAPTSLMFVISVVIAILAALSALGTLSILPIASVWLMGIAFLVLALACLFKGA
jgi:hypothetical protein